MPKRNIGEDDGVREENKKHKSDATKTEDALEMTPVRQIDVDQRHAALNTTAKRERQWQLEREAVSNEIEAASSSQVIVLDSDDEASRVGNNTDITGDQTEGEVADIWLEEAENCNSSGSINSPDAVSDESDNLFTKEEQNKQRERAREVVDRPRRSLIPSPWKRGQDVPEASTFLTDGDVSGIMWQQPRGLIKFGARAIEATQRNFSGSLEGEEEDQAVQGNGNSNATNEQSILDEQLTTDAVEHEASGAESDSTVPDDSSNVVETKANEKSSLLEESSLSPQPLKIPVNFNDTTLSEAQSSSSEVVVHSSAEVATTPPSADQELDRLSTPPRSAMKGSRQSQGLDIADSPNARKVLFAERARVQHESGSERSESVVSERVIPLQYLDGLELAKDYALAMAALKPPRGPSPEPQPPVQSSGSWFGWLWGKKTTDPVPEPPSPPRQTRELSIDGMPDDDEAWEATRAAIASNRTTVRRTSPWPVYKLPSYLRFPSYPSDPYRDPAIPLAVSGDFTNSHFRTLNIIYRKTKRPRFHGPSFQDCRAGLKRLMGEKFVTDETASGLGVFEWVVGEGECVVVERFMQEIEHGYNPDRVMYVTVNWGWTEREIMERLFRVVVGEVVRGEELL